MTPLNCSKHPQNTFTARLLHKYQNFCCLEVTSMPVFLKNLKQCFAENRKEMVKYLDLVLSIWETKKKMSPFNKYYIK